MSVVLLAVLIVAAVLLSSAVALALHSYDEAATRVSEETRQRLVDRYPYGSSESGNLLAKKRGR